MRHPFYLILASLLLAGCEYAGTASRQAGQSGAADKYDVSKMNLKSPPAKVSDARNKGDLAAGKSLSMDAVLKPLDPSPVK